MNEQLVRALIEFNKEKPEKISPKLEVIKAKMYGGFRLTLMRISETLSRSEEEKMWSRLQDSLDGGEHIPKLREQFSGKYNPAEIFDIISKFYLKPGFLQTDRQFLLENPLRNLPLDSTIYLWSENDYSYAESNMPMIYSETLIGGGYFLGIGYIGNVYHVKVRKGLDDLVAFVKRNNFQEKSED